MLLDFVSFLDEKRMKKCSARVVGPRPNGVNKIENDWHVNKGEIHRITISSSPCGKLVQQKWWVQELEVDNIMFDHSMVWPGVWLRLGDAFLVWIFGILEKKIRVYVQTLPSLHLIRIWSLCFLLLMFYFTLSLLSWEIWVRDYVLHWPESSQWNRVPRDDFQSLPFLEPRPHSQLTGREW